MATLSYLAEFCHLSKQKLVTVEANVLKYLTLYEDNLINIKKHSHRTLQKENQY